MILFATSALVVTVAMVFGGGATPSP